MKKRMTAIMPLLCLICSLLFGCGVTDADSAVSTGSTEKNDHTDSMESADQTTAQEPLWEEGEYYDIFVEQEHIFQWEEKDGKALPKEGSRFIGMQFYQNEPVQLWLIPDKIPWIVDLCLCRPDGSREVLIEEISVEHTYHAYLDQEGNIYWWYNPIVKREAGGAELLSSGMLVKYLSSGEVLFEKPMDTKLEILDMCQAENGRLYATMRGEEDLWLVELDPATGQETKLFGGQPVAKAMDSLTLGICKDQPASWFMNTVGIIGADKGANNLVLGGSSYMAPTEYNIRRIKHDFRILEDGSVEVLWADSNGGAGLVEKLTVSKIEKTPIVVRAWAPTTWLTKRIAGFNQSNETYHVVIDNQAESREDFARLTSIEIASGKGPDILTGGLMYDYILGMMEKGALEDLRPYMEESGIREEDYFPFVFAQWRDDKGIYGVNPSSPGLYGYVMEASVLLGTQEPDIEVLVDALLARQEKEAFMEGFDSQDLLDIFLKGSDTLWGMVDWEQGSCDFHTDLFAKLLETAKRYSDETGGGEKSYIASYWGLHDIFHFESLADRTEEGKVVCGVMFDDGCHAAVASSAILVINANSSNKEGAWEFISYLLSDDTQIATDEIGLASRNAFDTWVEKQREKVADGKEIYELRRGARLPDGSYEIVEQRTFSEADVTKERVQEYLETLEDARICPFRISPVLEIIKEEAEYYFNGSKSAEEVSRIITNRVQLYLDERK